MRTTPKITVTLEGNTWQDILDEMTIIQDAAKCPRIDYLPGQTNIAKEARYYLLDKLSQVLLDYGLGPEERAEILERVR